MPQYDTTIAALSGSWPDQERRRTEYDIDACLIVVRGRKPGQVYMLTEPSMRIGRDSTADIVIDDPSVSRNQALIETREDGIYLVDGGSTNGTHVNDEKIGKGQSICLQRQDLIFVGDTELKYHPKGDRDAYYIRALEIRASQDGLTRIYNKGFLLEAMDFHFAKAIARNSELSLMVIDLDKFKAINDTYGHDVGDQVLMHTAKLGTELFASTTAVFGRFGGEEFMALLPGVGPEEALELAELLRVTLSCMPPMVDGRPVMVTASIGVAAKVSSTASAQALFKRADQAVYKAKEAGRNRVEMG